MDDENNPIKLINGRLVDISKLSDEELDKILADLNDQIATLEKEIEDDVFSEDNIPFEDAFDIQEATND